MPDRQPYTFDRVVRIIITVIGVLGALWLINYLKDVLLPFCVAVLIAYILEPFVQYNRRLLHLKGRVIAIFMTLFEACFLVACCCAIFAPRFIAELHEMAQIFRNYAASAADIQFLPHEVHQFIQRNIDFNKLSTDLLNQEWVSILESALSTSWGIITSSFSILLGIFNWLIVVLYVIFIMIDYDRLARGFRLMVPPRYRHIVFKIGGDVKRSMNHYFRGQALVAFLVGILFSIGFSIVGLPMAIILGLFIGLLNMVPYLQLISIVPTTLLCLVYAAGGGGDFWTIFWECIAVYAVVQAIQDLFLTPKIMGKAMGLNPAIILLSLSIWGTLLGLIGLIIALPMTTLILAYYNEYVIGRDDHDDHSQTRRERRLFREITEKPEP